MSRLMSVSLTEDAVRDRRKTVTRRLGWTFLKPGDRLTLCRKVMGRRKGEPLVRIAEVEVVSVMREPLLRGVPRADARPVHPVLHGPHEGPTGHRSDAHRMAVPVVTNPHNPDPLHWPEIEPPEVAAVRLMRDRETSDEHGSHGWLGLVLLAFVLLAAGTLAVHVLAALQDAATPSSGPSAAHPASAQSGVPQVEPAAPAAVEKSGRGSVIPASGGTPRTISGTATWYCLSGSSACTRGFGQSDLVAAIDTDLGFRKGDHVTVTYRGRSVTVRIVDTCACPGDRLIDLTSGAFVALVAGPNPKPAKARAALGVGVIPVSLRLAGPGVTLPPTDSGEAP